MKFLCELLIGIPIFMVTSISKLWILNNIFEKHWIEKLGSEYFLIDYMKNTTCALEKFILGLGY